MSSKEHLSVEDLIKDFERKHPFALKRLYEFFKNNEYNNITIEEAQIFLYNKIKDYYSVDDIFNAEILRLYALWLHEKVQFDLSLSDIKNTPFDDTLNMRKLRKQPFKCYYVNLDDSFNISGFFICTSYYSKFDNFISEKKQELYLSLVYKSTSKKICHINFCIPLINSNDLRMEIEKGWYKVTGTNPLTDKTPIELLKRYINDLNNNNNKFTLECTEIKRINNNINTHSDTIPQIHIRKLSDIGYNYNHKPTNKGGTKQPHIRKGHWHHFWVGSKNKGDRQLILKWVESTPVNATDGNDLPITEIELK